jgi:hypothetical protein
VVKTSKIRIISNMKNTLGLRVSYLCTDINYHPSHRHHW